MQEQAQLVVTIPCHLRSSAAQAVVDECEKSVWPLVRQPSIGMHGGMVSAPFSFQVFLAASDIAVLRLLAHYDGHTRNSFDDFPVSGEREVGSQLREAASRNPSRFLKLLPTYWANISDNFCDAIMEGVAAYLAHRHGNLQANGSWTPIEEPDAVILARNLLDELDRHPAYWHHNRAASNALQACAHVIQNRQDAGRLVFWAIDFSTLSEQSSISGDGVDLITVGINMARGHVVEALMILANQLGKITPWPELLAPALRRFAADEHPAIRAVLLRRLPYLQSHHPDLGWDLFECVMRKHAAGLWPAAERCLYYAYYEQFEIVAPLLARLSCEGSGKDLETWGRISALAALSKQLEFSAFLSDITAIDSAEAWRGATSVWTNANNMEQHREQCVAGLEAGSSADNQHAGVVALKIERLFRETSPPTSVPSELIKRCFAAHEANPATHKSDVYGFEAWLNATSQRDAEQSLSAAEIYLGFVRSAKPHLYGHGNDLTQLLTRLFAQSEEQEESDGGAMLRRVVALQDTMLALGFGEMNEWLKAAERP